MQTFSNNQTHQCKDSSLSEAGGIFRIWRSWGSAQDRSIAFTNDDDSIEGQKKDQKGRTNKYICYRYCKVLPQLLLLLSSSTALLLPLLWHCYDILQPEVLSAASATTPAAYQSPATHTNNDTTQMRAVYKTPNSAASVAIQLLFIRVSKYCSWVALLISALNLGSTSPNAIFEKSSKNILHWCRCRRTLSGHPFFQSLTFCLGKTWFLLRLLSTFSCEWMCFITSV